MRISSVYQLLVFLLVLCAQSSVAQGRIYFIAPNGNDSSNDGTIERPFASLNAVSGSLRPGDIVYARGGKYKAVSWIIQAKGKPAQPILIASYPGERAVLDGTGGPGLRYEDCNLLGNGNAIIHLDHAQYVIFQGFELANSIGCGLTFTDAVGLSIKNNTVHDVWGRAIGGGGENIVMEDNTIYRAVLANENGKARIWGACSASWAKLDRSLSKNFTWRRNHIYNCWGEGLTALLVDGATIEGNRVHDVYSVNIYVDHSRNVSLVGNSSYVTNSAYKRRDQNSNAIGISLATELYELSPMIPLENVSVRNNTIDGTSFGIAYWRDGRNVSPINTYRNIVIKNNVIKNTQQLAVIFAQVPAGFQTPSNNTFSDNQLCGKNSAPGVQFGNPGNWKLQRNINSTGKCKLTSVSRKVSRVRKPIS